MWSKLCLCPVVSVAWPSRELAPTFAAIDEWTRGEQPEHRSRNQFRAELSDQGVLEQSRVRLDGFRDFEYGGGVHGHYFNRT